MDDKTKSLLVKWKLDKLISQFEEEEIDYEALMSMDRELVQRLKLSIGTEAKLLSNLKKLQTLNTSKGANSENYLMNDVDEKSMLERSLCTISTPSEIFWPHESTPKRKESFTDCEQEKTKRFHYSAISLDVKELLSSDIVGQNLLKSYEFRNPQCLLGKERAVLTHKVIDKALTMSIDLRRNDFIHLFHEIQNVFPSEIMDTYFIPCKGNMKHSLGRLPNYYRNLKQKLVTTKSKRLKISDSMDGDIENIKEHDLEVLQNNVEPMDKIVELWKVSSQSRLRSIKDATNLQEVFKEWPCFKNAYGHKLINIDFETGFPGKHFCLLQNWEMFKQKVVGHMTMSLRDDSSVLLLQNYPHLSENAQNLMVLKLLPKLLIPANRKSGGSIAGARESYLLHIEDPLHLEPELTSRRKEAAREKKDVQPFMIVVGALNNITSIMISVDDFQWNVSSIVEGFDTLFKTYLVLNLQYPIASMKFWTFIQRAIFNIKTANDMTAGMSSINTLINDLELVGFEN